ncbi:hypothetical protein F7234_12245 [Pseudomonas putida]|uniref:hypothetical protein n=1 Tax=Pseudomonas putida TaxID=303 RepID=UPI00125EA0C2|nr:hypothetical protein [Pseudomonas putida]KAB5623161.1 hypothetical protein F7234_12245 [Pseudomonas putida]
MDKAVAPASNRQAGVFKHCNYHLSCRSPLGAAQQGRQRSLRLDLESDPGASGQQVGVKVELVLALQRQPALQTPVTGTTHSEQALSQIQRPGRDQRQDVHLQTPLGTDAPPPHTLHRDTPWQCPGYWGGCVTC